MQTKLFTSTKKIVGLFVATSLTACGNSVPPKQWITNNDGLLMMAAIEKAASNVPWKTASNNIYLPADGISSNGHNVQAYDPGAFHVLQLPGYKTTWVALRLPPNQVLVRRDIKCRSSADFRHDHPSLSRPTMITIRACPPAIQTHRSVNQTTR